MAPEEEAEELLACPDPEAALRRRLTGEPLAWITGRTTFCDIELVVHPGVYVPRWHTEALARRAAELRPAVAVDLCTGCGALARVMMQAGARVVAGDLDPRAVANARANGVDAHVADLFDGLPPVEPEVVTAVVPYVPTRELPLLQRDTLAFESPLSYDGGEDGMALVRRVIDGAPPGCTLLLELGEPQVRALGAGDPIRDDEGDVRGVVLIAPGSA